MAKKKQKKSELVLVGALVPPSIAEAVKKASGKDKRSVSAFVGILIEKSPEVQAALRN